MNLPEFGQKLRELRTSRGLSQAALARQLPVSADLISIWERAYQHRGRTWRPDRAAVVRLIEIFADSLDMTDVQRWTAQAGYRLGQTELQKIFPTLTVPSDLSSRTPETTARSTLLAMLPDTHLFGIGRERQQLRLVLEQASAPWLVAIDGIGGIGKSSLAAALVRELASTDRFHRIAWTSAKQEEFFSRSGLEALQRPALDAVTLTDSLLEQLGEPLLLTRSPAEKQAGLFALLKKLPYLVVIDNLETVIDYQTLLPALRQWANPTKFLLTSRHTLHAYDDIYCFSLKELSQSDALALLSYEAEIRGATALASATPAQLASIYEVVGGNPLALKLVVGQTRVLPLTQVLDNLREARSKKIEDLYTYIYWQAWHALDEAGRQTLLVMPLAQGGTLTHIAALTDLHGTDLTQALEELVTLSLLEVSADLEQPRYRIHRLTETFLLNEVAKWQAPP
ncbi:MAG: helix-turn-helix domain-containing protein [Anaerolineales bacterium]|nr:helix-turn-helix domain-containing protein [Anaerolineales bacterium]